MEPGDELVDIVDLDDGVVGVVTRAEMRARNLRHRCGEILVRDPAGAVFVHRRTDTKDLYPGMRDMTLDELDRLVREREFCPDSVEVFERWRAGRLDP